MRIFFALVACFVTITAEAQSKVHPAIDTILTGIKNFNTQLWKSDSSMSRLLRTNNEESQIINYNFYNSILGRLQGINKEVLSFDNQISLELLKHEVLDELAGYQFKAYLNPILSDNGFHTTLAGYGNTVISSKKEAENYFETLRDIPRYIDQNIVLIRTGLTNGVHQPKVILSGIFDPFTSLLTDTIEKFILWKPFVKKPSFISESEWAAYQATAKDVLKSNGIPGFRKLNDFFQKEYKPKARSAIGASHLPNGKAFYENRVKHFTTTNLTSEEIYQIGLKEVARIKAQMDSVLKQVNFKGSFKEFINFLRTDQKFFPKTGEELLREASYIAKKIDGKLPSLFGKLPRQPYTVAPVPDYLAPSYTTGRYSSAPISSKKSGEYWVNVFNLPSRTLYTLEALTLHEAVPGHHLQIALTQELDLPEFRRNLYVNAFGEGWGLYSEYLGHEMGFYKDPYSLFGRLTYEMWRACRLVIDVGIHTKGWTREQAVAYLADHTALSLHEVNTEINRYISWPGQALAYKIGEIKIKEMRRKAEDALQADFDVRSFHDMVLSNGTVTLSILEKMTDRYITEQLEKLKLKK